MHIKDETESLSVEDILFALTESAIGRLWRSLRPPTERIQSSLGAVEYKGEMDEDADVLDEEAQLNFNEWSAGVRSMMGLRPTSTDNSYMNDADMNRFVTMVVLLKITTATQLTFSSLGLDALRFPPSDGESNSSREVVLKIFELPQENQESLRLDGFDPLTNTLLLLANTSLRVRSNKIKKINMAVLIVDCLSFLMESEIQIVESPSLDALFGGLLEAHASQNYLSTYLFQSLSLSLNTRSELIKRLIDRSERVALNALDKVLNDMVVSLEASAIYMPNIIRFANTDFARNKIFETLGVECDPPTLKFIGDEKDLTAKEMSGHSIVFKAVYHHMLSDEKLQNFETACRRFLHLVDENYEEKSVVERVYLSALALQVLDLAAMLISQLPKESTLNESRFFRSLGGDVGLKALTAVIALAPRNMSLYLLCRLSDIAVVVNTIQHGKLLARLGVEWWYSPLLPSLPSNTILNQKEIEDRQTALRLIEAKLVAVHLGIVSLHHVCQKEQLKPPTIASLFAVSDERSASTTDGEKMSLQFVKTMIDEQKSHQFAASVHLPVVADMYSFMREKFAYRLHDEVAARGMLVERALELLSIPDQRSGRRLFKRFLVAWEHLRKLFVTFAICAREVQQAAVIPHLTDHNGDRPCYVADLVELPGSDEHESLPARMLESRLLKHMRDFLTSDTVENLRDLHSFPELRRESLSSFCETAAGHVLFTGPRLSAKHWAGLEDYIICHTQWQFTSGQPSIPTDIQTNIEVVDFAAALQQRREAAAREAQLAAHNLGYILCPNCGMLNEHVSGCEHLTCGNPSNPYGRASVVPQGYGCGQALVKTVHRIPAPVPGQPVLKNFQPNDVGLPANMLNMELPSLPNIALSTGLHCTDWTVIARYLYANYVEGCVLVEGDRDFFAALQFASPAQLDRFSSLQNIMHLEAPEPSHSGNPTQQPGDVAKRLFDPKIANVFVRVKVVADMVDARIGAKPGSLTHAQQAKLQQWLSRQKEHDQEATCERLLVMCLQQLENAENCAESAGSVADLIGDSDRISHLLRIELGGFSTAQLSGIARILAAAGLEGFTCHHESLKSPLRQEDNVRLATIQSKVSSMTDLEQLSATEEELQRLGTLLAANVELMLKGKETTKLTELPTIKGFLDTQGTTLPREVLGRLRVQNYGSLMRFLRQLLGQISYLKLSRSSLSEPEPLPVNSSHSDSAKNQYVEAIPEEWERLQAAGSEPCHLPATVLMKRQRDRARDRLHDEKFVEKVDEESPSADLLLLRGASTTLSLAAAEQLRLLRNRSHLLPVFEDPGELADDSGEAAMEQEPQQEEVVAGEGAMVVEEHLTCFEAAWAVLQRAVAAEDGGPAVLLDSWGVGCAEDLQFVTEQLEDLTGLLRPAVAEQFRRAVGGLPLPEPAACFSAAWQLLGQWAGCVPPLQQLLDQLGVQTARDLQFVPDYWDQLALCLREVPRHKLLFLLPAGEEPGPAAFSTLRAWSAHSPALAATMEDFDIHSADGLLCGPAQWDLLAAFLNKVARERFLRALGLPSSQSRGCGPSPGPPELPSDEALHVAWSLLAAQTAPATVSDLLEKAGLCEAEDLLFLDLPELLQLADCFKLAQRNRLKKLLLL